jgi:hypothetical protein
MNFPIDNLTQNAANVIKKETYYPKQEPVLEGSFVYPASEEVCFNVRRQPEQKSIPQNKPTAYPVF